jgi:CTP synthase (UTP-ammonia lyase)
MHTVKIAIIGDYNFTFNAHHATNLALDHASNFLDVDVNYYWIRVSEVAQQKIAFFDQYDAFWIAPGPFINPFFLNGIFARLAALNKSVLITGEGYKLFIEYLIMKNSLNQAGEKLISDNLITGAYFENVIIEPKSPAFVKLYDHFTNRELSATRFSLYPNLRNELEGSFIDVEAINQFEDPEAISLKGQTFFLAVTFYPQVSSTRDLPHPIIYTFVKSAISAQQASHESSRV